MWIRPNSPSRQSYCQATKWNFIELANSKRWSSNQVLHSQVLGHHRVFCWVWQSKSGLSSATKTQSSEPRRRQSSRTLNILRTIPILLLPSELIWCGKCTGHRDLIARTTIELEGQNLALESSIGFPWDLSQSFPEENGPSLFLERDPRYKSRPLMPHGAKICIPKRSSCVLKRFEREIRHHQGFLSFH